MYLDGALFLHNILPLFGSGAFAAFLGYHFARSHKRFDARAAAEEKLIATGPEIIAEQNKRIEAQNKRIDSLESSYSSLWKELGQSMDRERICLAKIQDQERKIETQEQEIQTLKNRVASLERGPDQV